MQQPLSYDALLTTHLEQWPGDQERWPLEKIQVLSQGLACRGVFDTYLANISKLI